MLKLNDKDPLNTPVQTRDGKKARIICVDRKNCAGEATIIALVQDGNGHERCVFYSSNGGYFDSSNGGYFDSCVSTDDLVNIPQKITRYANIKITRYANIYEKGELEYYPGGVLYGTSEAAEEAVTNVEAYIATAKVEFEV